MRSPFQQTAFLSLASVLLPLAKLMLRCGLSCAEFVVIAKAVFVQAASDEYGLRGRPTNVSRVAAMTGLSRKEVRRIRSEGPVRRWTPDMEVNPANTLIHFWHFDPAFCEPIGRPKALPFEGESSFSALVRKYAGDLPPGAMRKELTRAGAIVETEDRKLAIQERYFFPNDFDDDFIRNAAYALKNLGETLVHNAALANRATAQQDAIRNGRFERFAWTDNLTAESAEAFKQWVRTEGGSFIELADAWIGEHEVPRDVAAMNQSRVVGVGIYFFEED